MSRGSSGAYLSAVFVDYDNIYLSLKRKSEDAAKRFAKDAYRWISAIQSGDLIRPRNLADTPVQRRVVMSRCYGNPVPRRNQSDNSTDMNSFPFVRHHFLRGGFEIVDCPPLTAQLKNSADIRMVMDIRDLLTHDTYFDEFVILSSDADFTPLLHRLRAHARRTMVYANDHTASPYVALSDGEIREVDLIELLLEGGEIEAAPAPAPIAQQATQPQIASEPQAPIEMQPAEQTIPLGQIRSEIVSEVVRAVLEASAPQPLEALAERAIRALGHQKTIESDWGGAGSFRDLLAEDLPPSVRLTEKAPYFAYDVARAVARQEQQRIAAPEASAQPAAQAQPHVEAPAKEAAQPVTQGFGLPPERASSLQQSIARIHQACEAPALSPPEYRALFTVLANEIANNGMQGVQTIKNVQAMSVELGIDAKLEDIRFIIDVVGKSDPWFENEVSGPIFAARFRNFVIARCQTAGMQLSSDEIDLIDAWFGGEAAGDEAAGAAGEAREAPATIAPQEPASAAQTPQPDAPALGNMHVPFEDRTAARTAQWWEETRQAGLEDLAVAGANDAGEEEFPRIVRNRFKG
jgi:hypothetical protein